MAIINGKEVYVNYHDDGTGDMFLLSWCQDNFLPYSKAAELLYVSNGTGEYALALRKIRRSLKLSLGEAMGKTLTPDMKKQIMEEIENIAKQYGSGSKPPK
jgi:hypothetical protein